MGRGKLIAGLESTPISAGNKPKLEFKTMTDSGDQAALNGLVDDCYGGQWPWKVGDLVVDEEVEFSAIVEILDNTIYTPHDGWTKEQKRYPYAGTWVEGRLRELLNEGVINYEEAMVVQIYGDGRTEVYPYNEQEFKGPPFFTEASPIQALAAALRVLKEKEVSGE